MKIYGNETAPSGKPRLLWATNIDELRLVFASLNKTMENFPHAYSEEFEHAYHTMNNMARNFKIFLQTKKESTNKHRTKDTPCPYCKATVRGDKALKQHIEDSHLETLK